MNLKKFRPLIIVLVFILIGCKKNRASIDPEIHFGDKVMVMSGFCKGHEGIIIGHHELENKVMGYKISGKGRDWFWITKDRLKKLECYHEAEKPNTWNGNY